MYNHGKNRISIYNHDLLDSMYIFKQANVGSEVTPHQDSTFLHTSPKQTVLGKLSSRVLDFTNLFKECGSP